MRTELRESKHLRQLKVLRNQLKKVHAPSNTKASKAELLKVSTELRQSKASVKQLKAERSQLKVLIA